MIHMTRSAVALAGLALLVAGCSTATSSSHGVVASAAGSVAVSPSAEPTPIPPPTATPLPTPVGQQDLDMDLSLAYLKGLIEGPGTCSIGPDGIWIYLEHRTAGSLDVYLTVGSAQGGVGGGPIAGGGLFGPDAVRVRIFDLLLGGSVDTEEAHADLAPDLRSGQFTGTWNDAPLVADYTCS